MPRPDNRTGVSRTAPPFDGLWTFSALQGQIAATEKALHALTASRWDISGVERFDTVGLRLLGSGPLPWRELSVESYRAGVTALGITALVGYLIGMVLSYLSAQPLLQYGANIFIVDFLGIAVLRELGPLLCAILIAGRSGPVLIARIGAMKLSQ